MVNTPCGPRRSAPLASNPTSGHDPGGGGAARVGFGIEEDPMTDECASTHESTDDEYAFLRHVRFGELPDHVPLADLVELVETDPQRETHEPIEPRREWA
jgi:hypothetical protein